MANCSTTLHQELMQMKKEISRRDGWNLLPIRPVYLVSVEHEGKRNIISIGMFSNFSSARARAGKLTLVGIGVAPSRYTFVT